MNYPSFIETYFPTAVKSHLHRERLDIPDASGKVETKKCYTKHTPPSHAELERSSKWEALYDIGLSPFLEDGKHVRWGVIDIDEYGVYTEQDLQSRLDLWGIPLTINRSKSGGFQLILTCSQPMKARDMRNTLTKISIWIGINPGGELPSIEILPKQSSIKVGEETGTEMILPKADLMAAVVSNTRDTDQWNAIMSEGDFQDAAPCIFPVMRGHEREDASYRNETLYQMCIVFRYKFPKDWQDKVREANQTIFKEPMEEKEVEALIKQQERGAPYFKCKSAPFDKYCNRKLCVKRDFGIKVKEGGPLGQIETDGIVVMLTEPRTWFVSVIDSKGESHRLKMTSEEMWDVNRFSKRYFDTVLEVPDLPSQKKWRQELNKLVKEAKIMEVPPNMTEAGKLSEQVSAYLASTPSSSKPEAIMQNKVYVKLGESMTAYFNLSHFHNYLEQMRLRKCSLGELVGLMTHYSFNKLLDVHQAHIAEIDVDCWGVPVREPILREILEQRITDKEL